MAKTTAKTTTNANPNAANTTTTDAAGNGSNGGEKVPPTVICTFFSGGGFLPVPGVRKARSSTKGERMKAMHFIAFIPSESGEGMYVPLARLNRRGTQKRPFWVQSSGRSYGPTGDDLQRLALKITLRASRLRPVEAIPFSITPARGDYGVAEITPELLAWIQETWDSASPYRPPRSVEEWATLARGWHEPKARTGRFRRDIARYFRRRRSAEGADPEEVPKDIFGGEAKATPPPEEAAEKAEGEGDG